MSGLFGTLDVASRGLAVTQTGIRVSAHNTSNVETPGFSRQRQVLAAGPAVTYGNGQLGTGVEQTSIERVTDTLLLRQLDDETARAASLDVEAGALGRIEEIFNEQQTDGIGAQLSAFFDALDELASATTPGAPVERSNVREAAISLIDSIRAADERLRQIMEEADRNAIAQIDTINGIARQIGQLNGEIVREDAVAPANDLRDLRDKLVRDLAQLIDVKSFERDDGQLVVMVAGGAPIVDGVEVRSLDVEPDPAHPFEPSFARIVFDDGSTRSDITARIGGGEIGGWLAVRDGSAAQAIRDLDVLAFNTAERINGVHQLGTGLDGTVGNFFQALPGVADAARDIALDPAVAGSLDAIAAGLGTGTGDNRNALALAALRGSAAPIYQLGDLLGAPSGPTRSLLDHHAVLVSAIGEDARVVDAASRAQKAVVEELETRRDSIAGVSLDEEMVKLIRLQAAYNANARVVTTIERLLETLTSML